VCVKLTTRLHLVPRSRMCEAIPPLPNTPSLCDDQLKSIGTTLPLPLPSFWLDKLLKNATLDTRMLEWNIS